MCHNTSWISRSCAPFERIEAARQINKSQYCFGKCEHQTFCCWSTINKYTILHNTHLHVFNFRISLCLFVYFSLLMFCTKKISKEFFQINQGSRNRFSCAYGIVLKMANIRIKRNNCNPKKAKFVHIQWKQFCTTRASFCTIPIFPPFSNNSQIKYCKELFLAKFYSKLSYRK